MLKQFRNMGKAGWDNPLNEGHKHRLSRYVLYAVGEIILVVIGILIALKINNWNIGRLEAKEEIQVYQNIRQQITEDLLELENVNELNNHHTRQFELANRIITQKDQSKIDTLAVVTMLLSQHSDFHRNSNIYETLVNSGNLKLLKNQEIISHLQQLEMIYTHLNRLEDIHWDIILKELSPVVRGVINYATLEVVHPDKLYGVELQNIFVESIYLTKGKSYVYLQAMDEIAVLHQLLDQEIKPYMTLE